MTRPAGWRAARFHLLCIALLYALVIPVAVIDQRALGGNGGNWISLDMRGLLVAAYLIAAGIFVAVLLLHLNLKRLGKPFSLGLLVGCLLAPALAVPIGAAIYGLSVRFADEQRAHAVTKTANTLADAIALRWSVGGGQMSPIFEVELTSALPVEVLDVAVSGSADSRNGEFIASASSEEGSVFRLQPGVPHRVALSLDHAPTADTYWSVFCRLAMNGTMVGVNWVDPGREPFGGDAVRRIPLH